ncbi:MAG: thiamine diphosphokinase [Atopobiaceae bacterium]
MKTLIVGGSPEPSSTELVAKLAHEADYVIAADKGAEMLVAAGIAPDLFCGDEDSVGGGALETMRSLPLPEKRYPWKKDDTDFGLAVRLAEQEAEERQEPLDLVCTCVSGGRPDHALGVFGVMAEFAEPIVRAKGSLVLHEDGFICRMLVAGTSWKLGSEAKGHTFSALSLAARSVVTERGMLWTPDHSALGILDDRGVSNQVTEEASEIVCHEGMVAAFLLQELGHTD